MILGRPIAVGTSIAGCPPAQIPAGVIHAPGSHLGWLTTNPTSSFSYTFKPLGHAFPARCPVRVLLSRVSLGPFPWLCQLRPRLPRFVRWPLTTVEGSDFSRSFFIGFDSSSSRCGPLQNCSSGQAGDLPVLVQRAYLHARV